MKRVQRTSYRIRNNRVRRTEMLLQIMLSVSGYAEMIDGIVMVLSGGVVKTGLRDSVRQSIGTLSNKLRRL